MHNAVMTSHTNTEWSALLALKTAVSHSHLRRPFDSRLTHDVMTYPIWRAFSFLSFLCRTTTAMAASAADPASDRIFKGYIADPHDFPWMVKLKVGIFRGGEKCLLGIWGWGGQKKWLRKRDQQHSCSILPVFPDALHARLCLLF